MVRAPLRQKRRGGGFAAAGRGTSRNHRLTKMFPNSISTGRIQLRMNLLAYICVTLIILTVKYQLQFTRTGNTKNIYPLTYKGRVGVAGFLPRQNEE